MPGRPGPNRRSPPRRRCPLGEEQDDAVRPRARPRRDTPGALQLLRPAGRLAPALPGRSRGGRRRRGRSPATTRTGTTPHDIAGRSPPCSSTLRPFFFSSGFCRRCRGCCCFCCCCSFFSLFSSPRPTSSTPSAPLRPSTSAPPAFGPAHPAADPDRFSSLMGGGRGRRRQVGSFRSRRRSGGGRSIHPSVHTSVQALQVYPSRARAPGCGLDDLDRKSVV